MEENSMRIFDENGLEIQNPDYERGHLKEDRLLVAHHEAVEAVAENGHWETIAEYPNGGKDVAWVVDVPGVEAAEAWDEYEDILRYIPYTAEELAEIDRQRNHPTPEQRIAELEEALALLLSGVTE